MKIKDISIYKGRWCAELEDGRFVLSNGRFELVLCGKVPTGFVVLKGGIAGGIMMRTREDFAWCVNNLRPEDVA